MNNNFNVTLLFITTTVLSLIIDLSQFFILGKIIAPFVLALYCASLMHNTSRGSLIYSALLLCLESFCFFNYSLLPLIYIIPVSFFAFYCKKNLYPSPFHGIIFALFCSFVQLYGIEYMLLFITFPMDYTLLRITATLIVEMSFSLTIKYWGILDNRA